MRWSLVSIVIAACGANVDLGGEPLDASRDTRDGSAVCHGLAVPDASAPCGGCNQGDKGCQPNGCFNGYLCDVSEHDCKAPGAPCSDDVKFDAQ